MREYAILNQANECVDSDLYENAGDANYSLICKYGVISDLHVGLICEWHDEVAAIGCKYCAAVKAGIDIHTGEPFAYQETV